MKYYHIKKSGHSISVENNFYDAGIRAVTWFHAAHPFNADVLKQFREKLHFSRFFENNRGNLDKMTPIPTPTRINTAQKLSIPNK